MPTLFYEIFNKEVKLTSKTLKRLIEELNKLFDELKSENNIDNIKVLRNKLTHLLEDKPKKLDKKSKTGIKRLKSVLREINKYIKEKTEEKNDLMMVNVIEKVEKDHRPYDSIPKKKQDKYLPSSIKKETFNYEKEKIELQVELLKLQKHIKET
jgi:ElaB/YqjD/DUF883 family membrane-anchored ribosome-binding protein